MAASIYKFTLKPKNELYIMLTIFLNVEIYRVWIVKNVNYYNKLKNSFFINFLRLTDCRNYGKILSNAKGL